MLGPRLPGLMGGGVIFARILVPADGSRLAETVMAGASSKKGWFAGSGRGGLHSVGRERVLGGCVLDAKGGPFLREPRVDLCGTDVEAARR